VYENSPAEEAGLEIEDILLTFDGKPVYDTDELRDLVDDVEVDQEVNLTYLRNGEEHQAEATISENEQGLSPRYSRWSFPHKGYRYYYDDREYAWLGVDTEELTPQLRTFFVVPEDLGILVKEVSKDGPAEEAGLKAGDIIIRIDKREIEDTYDLIKAINRYDPEEEITVSIIREKKESSIVVKLGKQKGTPRHFYSLRPHRYEVIVPDVDIDIPDIEIEIPDFDEEELRELKEQMDEEIEINREELQEEMEELKEHMKELKIKTKDRNGRVI
jgi:C-terminal processing protease CtpA/Prc